MSEKKVKSRKLELKTELDAIHKKEMAEKVEEMAKIDGSIDSKIKIANVRMHNGIMFGDFMIKFFMALFIALAFFYTVYTGVNDESAGLVTKTTIKSNVHFQMISVLGPLFGAIIQYYFGKTKSASNGE